MGLDINAYRNLKPLNAPNNEGDDPVNPSTGERECDHFRVWNLEPYRGRCQGLVDRGFYTTGESIEVFSCGYGTYGRWREELAKLAGYPTAPLTRWGMTEQLHSASVWNGAQGPFRELIDFADNEGVIGPVVCARLAKDFADFNERASAIGGEFFAKYQAFRDALAYVGDQGCIHFT